MIKAGFIGAKSSIYDLILSCMVWFASLTSRGSLVQSQSCPPVIPSLSVKHFKNASDFCHASVTTGYIYSDSEGIHSGGVYA